MSLSVERLRRAFAFSAVAIVLVVAGFYLYGRLRSRPLPPGMAAQVGSEIQQSTTGFTYSRSEGGRTVFTIHASKQVQFRQGGRIQLQDVSIVVYGRQSNRFDQIYGADFEYDPQSGEISAPGEVNIDLEADVEGPLRPDQAPPKELKNPIHVSTHGLTFNRNTGLASATGALSFRVPQGSGSAVGASYDSRANLLTLRSQVQLRLAGPQGATVHADHADFSKEPRQAVLSSVHIEQVDRSMDCQKLTLFLRDDNTLDHAVASGDVRAAAQGPTTAHLRAPQADFRMGPGNQVRSAVLSGGVALETTGETVANGTAGKAVLDFGPRNHLTQVSTSDGVKFTQPPRPAQGKTTAAQGVDLAAAGVDFFVKDGKVLDHAVTNGAAQITLLPAGGAAPGGSTVVTADQFQATFDARNHLRTLHGAPHARIVSTTPGKPDRTSASQSLTVSFAPRGGIAGVLQEGGVQYAEGPRTATAGQARYNPADDTLVLTGAPRVSEAGLTTTAQTIRFDRRNSQASAEGDVKSTYLDLKPQPGGALLASSDPIHVTARSATVRQATGVARYTGQARLWQGANVVQAPVIVFDREHRTLTAQSANGELVSTVFVQQSEKGRVTPVNVLSERLAYADSERRAHFEGGVTMKSADATLTAGQATVVLVPRGEKSEAGATPTASQVEQVTAEGQIHIQEADRQAQGEHLVYTPDDGKFVLTGGFPSIFDAEHGSVTGDSLTFFS
ncbi:MAG TPA: LptA/OstA family protein, partial [Terriglobales bacterium]|nr:LptA/OstA family protein [Terriglobales bacterium]